MVGVFVAFVFATLYVFASPDRGSSGRLPPSFSRPPVILISLDGFRWDYLQRSQTPALNSLIASGVHANIMRPIFPSKTFPNHYTLVTGLYAESHGIVGNDMYDPTVDQWFHIDNPNAVRTY